MVFRHFGVLCLMFAAVFQVSVPQQLGAFLVLMVWPQVESDKRTLRQICVVCRNFGLLCLIFIVVFQVSFRRQHGEFRVTRHMDFLLSQSKIETSLVPLPAVGASSFQEGKWASPLTRTI